MIPKFPRTFFICCFLIPAQLFCLSAFSQNATLVVKNAKISTLNPAQPDAEAIAVQGDRIIFVGTDADVAKHISIQTKVIDAGGKWVTPGWIEGHGHIHGMGESMISLNLMNVKNWDEIVALVDSAVKKAKPGDWIIGRGWHQEKWSPAPSNNYLGYPYHETVDRISPDNPVLLTHASGHSVYVNNVALQQAGITDKTPNPSGGDIVKDNGKKIVGVLEERAQNLAWIAFERWNNKRPFEERKAEWARSIGLAENECLRNGITSFVDAGSSFQQAEGMRQLAEAGKLQIRHWLMIRSGITSLESNAKVFNIKNAGNHHLTVKAIKVSLDGALGSYGAWLLEPYADRKDFYGQNTFDTTELKKIARFAWANNLQLCVHAIGDKANRKTIDIFEDQINTAPGRDHRWRIEHAQHLNPVEIPRFKSNHIIASMQGIHCTSDAPFVLKRLGAERAESGAYMWRSFIDEGVLVNSGTDVPVENIDPIANFYALVTRKLKDGTVFYPQQKMTRQEALYSYTLANAIAAFEEKDKGSLEPGKLADIIMLSNNLLNCSEEEIKNTKVVMTIVGGSILFGQQQQ